MVDLKHKWNIKMLYPENVSAILEFKESFPKNHQIIKTIVGFCNRKGGKIVRFLSKRSFRDSEEAIREILLNALVHRNYHLPSPTKVSIYDNRIEFFSPGDFPGPLNPKNLRTGLTYIRNPIICSMFHKAKLIEKMGTGFITVYDSFEKRRLKSPEIIEGENFVKCLLPREKISQRIELMYSSDLQKILNLFEQAEAITVSDVMNVLNLPRTTSYRKLTELLKKGIIERIGVKKSAKYTLKRNDK